MTRAAEGDRLIPRWREKDGPPVTPPTRKGFGLRVIESGPPHEQHGRNWRINPVS
jgi:two-component sensor histidine kinase